MKFHPDRNTDNFKEELSRFLKRGAINIHFQKADGTERYMDCTLQEGVIPHIEVDPQRKSPQTSNPTTVVVWDTQKQAWRTVKFDRIYNYQVLPK